MRCVINVSCCTWRKIELESECEAKSCSVKTTDFCAGAISNANECVQLIVTARLCTSFRVGVTATLGTGTGFGLDMGRQQT